MWSAPELGLINARIKSGNLMGFGVDILCRNPTLG
jgi:hypothetical protein